jgi:hypothetical protein
MSQQSLPARLSALTRAQVETVNGRPTGWDTCVRCKAEAPGAGLHGLCRPCMLEDGQAWRKARDRGENDGIITIANWRK